MNKKDLVLKPKSHPLLAELSDYLKDPGNYMEIKKKILDTLAVGHSHSELLGYASCVTCTANMEKRRKLLRDLGFKNPAQYRAWDKVHTEIAKKFPLVDWKQVNLQRAIEDLKQ